MGNWLWIIASELASKLTDAGGEVFCYTFGAINTGTNRKGTYANIKNVINEDDYIPKMMNKNIYSKPGQIYSNSIKENLMFEYRDITGNTDYRGDYCLSNFLTHIFEVKKNGVTIDKYRQLVEEMARNLTYFTSLSREVQIDGEISDLAIAYDNMTNANKDAHSIKSYYVLAKSLNGFDLLDGDGKKQEHYERIDEGLVFAFTRTETILTDQQKTQIDSKCDGYPFSAVELDNYISAYSADPDRKCKKVKNYMYTYYTINDNNAVERDVSYVKFWYGDRNSKPKDKKGNIEKIYEYEAGNLGKSTKFTYSGYYDNSLDVNDYIGYVKKYTDLDGGLDTLKRNTIVTGNSNIVEIYGRIIAAFPPALFNEDTTAFENSTNDMHKYSNYAYDKDKNNNIVDAKHYDGQTIAGQPKDMFKLVDVVMEYRPPESAGERYQFVVPFVAIDAKLMHLNFYKKNATGKFSNLTDNRYGQVEEKPTQDKYKLDSKNKKVLDKDATRVADYVSPIEPYIRNGGESKNTIHANLLKIICGIKDDNNGENVEDFRIVSMRIYKDDYAVAKYIESEDEYVLNVNEWKNIRNGIEDLKAEDGSDLTLEQKKTKLKSGVIVDYGD